MHFLCELFNPNLFWWLCWSLEVVFVSNFFQPKRNFWVVGENNCFIQKFWTSSCSSTFLGSICISGCGFFIQEFKQSLIPNNLDNHDFKCYPILILRIGQSGPLIAEHTAHIGHYKDPGSCRFGIPTVRFQGQYFLSYEKN